MDGLFQIIPVVLFIAIVIALIAWSSSRNQAQKRRGDNDGRNSAYSDSGAGAPFLFADDSHHRHSHHRDHASSQDSGHHSSHDSGSSGDSGGSDGGGGGGD